MNIVIPADARRSGMATFRKGSQTHRVQHWSTRDGDWIAQDGQPVEVPSGPVMVRLWDLGDQMIEDGWTCTSSSIIGMGTEINHNYFTDGVPA